MAAKSPESRRLIARLGGLTLASKHDPQDYSAAGRQTFRDNFLAAVDPERELPEVERTRRAQAALKAHMLGLALRSAKARAKTSDGSSG